jgi:hypothetical protein
MSVGPSDRVELARRRGRRIGIVVFALLVSGTTAIWTLQIIRQVWFPRVSEQVECRQGLRTLLDSVRRARGAAAAETGGERRALGRFRQELDGHWRYRPAIGEACKGDLLALAFLADIDRLRFAEEHAVRYEAVDLAQRRRRVQALERELWGAQLDGGSMGNAP